MNLPPKPGAKISHHLLDLLGAAAGAHAAGVVVRILSAGFGLGGSTLWVRMRRGQRTARAIGIVVGRGAGVVFSWGVGAVLLGGDVHIVVFGGWNFSSFLDGMALVDLGCFGGVQV